MDNRASGNMHRVQNGPKCFGAIRSIASYDDRGKRLSPGRYTSAPYFHDPLTQLPHDSFREGSDVGRGIHVRHPLQKVSASHTSAVPM